MPGFPPYFSLFCLVFFFYLSLLSVCLDPDPLIGSLGTDINDLFFVMCMEQAEGIELGKQNAKAKMGMDREQNYGKGEKTLNVQEWKKDQKRLTRTRCRGEGELQRWESALQCWNSGTHFRWSITLIDFRLITTEIFAPLCKVMMWCWRWGVQMCASLLNDEHSITGATMSITLYQTGKSTQRREYIPSWFYDFQRQSCRQNNTPFPKKKKKKRALPLKTFQNRWNRSDASLEKKCWWWQGVEAHILGLDGIQVEGIHSTGTGTKLLAVLVWLSNQTTHSCAR